MAKARFSDPAGLTVAQLKSILSDIPEKDSEGDDQVVYCLVGNAHLSPLTEVILDDEDSSIMVPWFHGDTMAELDTYGEFFGIEPEEYEVDDDDTE